MVTVGAHSFARPDQMVAGSSMGLLAGALGAVMQRLATQCLQEYLSTSNGSTEAWEEIKKAGG